MLRYMPHVMSVLVAIAGCFLWWQSTLGLRAFTWESHRRLQIEQQPIMVPNVPLQDHRGRLLDMTSLRGKLVVANFIYTRCPTVCGVAGARFLQLQKMLAQRGLVDRVQLLSISLEPEYDNPARLLGYLQRFSQRDETNWQLVRVSPPQLTRPLLDRLGVVSIPDGVGGITHNAATHIIDLQGRLVRILDEDKPEQALEVIDALLSASRQV